MHQMNGIETARKTRELDKHVILVLLTSRGILVNMDFISRFTDKDIILQNEMHVPITIRKQKQLLQTWYNYDFAKLHREAAERSPSGPSADYRYRIMQSGRKYSGKCLPTASMAL